MAKAVSTLLSPGSRLLEVGSWMGHGSTQIWLNNMPKDSLLVCVDRWESYISQTDADDAFESYVSMHKLARTAMNVALNAISSNESNTVVIKGKSAQSMTLLQKESFDFIYIDGSHYYPDVKSDLQLAKSLLRDGGYLCGDDLELNPENYLIDIARQHVERDYICLSNGHCFHPGVLLAISEEIPCFTNYGGFWICQKSGDSFQAIDL